PRADRPGVRWRRLGPRAREGSGCGPAARRGPPSAILGQMSEHVLVVDDDPPVRRMLERTLSAEGHAVTTAADGGAALAAVEREAPDLVILDVAMPGLDGLAVTQRLRGKGVTAPILLLTARDAVADRVEGLDAGA